MKLKAYQLGKDRALPKEKLKSLTEKLCGPLQLYMSSVNVTQTSSCQEGPTIVPVHVARTCQVSLECSHLVDYEGNTVL